MPAALVVAAATTKTGERGDGNIIKKDQLSPIAITSRGNLSPVNYCPGSISSLLLQMQHIDWNSRAVITVSTLYAVNMPPFYLSITFCIKK